jgi:hypothetical protein
VPVSTHFNSPKNEDETIIQPEGEPLAAHGEGTQGSAG